MSQAIEENITEIGRQIKQDRQDIERAKKRLSILKAKVSRVDNYINDKYDKIKTLGELPIKMREEEEKRNVK